MSPEVTYTLDSGVERNREAPDTFQTPPAAEREALQPGQLVKLMFRITHGENVDVERMWVKILERQDGGYSGALDNQPYSTITIQPGMPVRFRPEHVIQIWREQ